MNATSRIAAVLIGLLWAMPALAQQDAPPPPERPDCPTGAARMPCLAEWGHPQAQFEMGMRAFRGGEDANMAEALGWFARSAEAGFPRAQYMLGMMYLEGWGTEKDPEAALEWVDAAQRRGVFDRAKLKPRIERALELKRMLEGPPEGEEAAPGER